MRPQDPPAPLPRHWSSRTVGLNSFHVNSVRLREWKVIAVHINYQCVLNLFTLASDGTKAKTPC